jgi:hypothetical protein
MRKKFGGEGPIRDQIGDSEKSAPCTIARRNEFGRASPLP